MNTTVEYNGIVHEYHSIAIIIGDVKVLFVKQLHLYTPVFVILPCSNTS